MYCFEDYLRAIDAVRFNDKKMRKKALKCIARDRKRIPELPAFPTKYTTRDWGTWTDFVLSTPRNTSQEVHYDYLSKPK